MILRSGDGHSFLHKAFAYFLWLFDLTFCSGRHARHNWLKIWNCHLGKPQIDDFGRGLNKKVQYQCFQKSSNQKVGSPNSKKTIKSAIIN